MSQIKTIIRVLYSEMAQFPKKTYPVLGRKATVEISSVAPTFANF